MNTMNEVEENPFFSHDKPLQIDKTLSPPNMTGYQEYSDKHPTNAGSNPKNSNWRLSISNSRPITSDDRPTTSNSRPTYAN